MRISLNWLKEYVDIDVSVEELTQRLTMLGIEIEAIEQPGAEIANVFVGKILSIDPHPNADKLVVCKTDVGRAEPVQIICGAKNMKPGDKVPTAVVGATLPGGFQIGQRKMRGIESFGMMCSVQELGMGEEHDGLLILDPEAPIGEDIKPVLGLDDVILEVEITPNRGDWACMIGIARELAAYYGKPLRIPELVLRESAQKAPDLSSVTIEDPELCPRYIGRVLSGVKIKPSPQWMCQRLIAAGQRPINNVVDVTNYVLLETGHPLHAFDYEKLAENRIVVRRARVGESATTLDGAPRPLEDDMLVIADARNPQAVAGVMGGADSEVGETTTMVFLESAYFKPASIRRTSKLLGMSTEASQHFQRGADPEMALYAINRAAMLMQQLAEAEVAQGLLDEYPAPVPVKKVTLRYARTNRLLGTQVPTEQQVATIQGLGFTILDQTSDACCFRVPTWRHDVSMETDLIEEIARFYGYDQIPSTLPAARQTEIVFAPNEAVVRRLRHLLVGLGLTEFYNWTFSSSEAVQKAGLGDAYSSMVTLENPLSENYATMRSSLLPGLLANAAHNFNHNVPDLAAFEIGPVYCPVEGAELPDQPLRLGIVLAGTPAPKSWCATPAKADFYDLKGYAEAVLEFFGLSGAFQPSALNVYQQGQSAEVMMNSTCVGHFGKVKKTVLDAYGLGQDLFLLELHLSDMIENAAPRAIFQAIPGFPASLRDLAVLVDRDLPAGALLETARKAGGKLLKSVEVFDVYTGKQVPEGKKSVALNLLFQSGERTLTDADTQKAWDAVLKCLQKEYQAELR
jgi:phenylalanyl-tRNA synthetase beta chain